LLETELITDGSFSEDVVVVSGGTKHPITKAAIEQRLNKLDVLDPEGMKQRLEQKSMVNFIKVIRESVRKSGLKEEDISYLAMLHMKKSAHEYVLKELGLSQEQSIYLEDYGHIGQIDQILSLELGLKAGKVKEGDLVVFVSAGIGYAWGAAAIKWGKVS
jgi:3-oxoacyl-[acyl-carrier-protein] synthase-3